MEDYLRDSPYDESSETVRSLNALSAQLSSFDFDSVPNVFANENENSNPQAAQILDQNQFLEEQFEAGPTDTTLNFHADATPNFHTEFQPQFQADPQAEFPEADAEQLSYDFLTSPDVASLDQLVSPDMFTTPTYFLPGLRNFSSLNAITENRLHAAFSPVRTPATLRHGSVAEPFFRSPVLGAHEELSPYGSYLHSPPPIHVIPSTSVPAVPFQQPAPVLGVSAPVNRTEPRDTREKMDRAEPGSLTAEEKARRRREFHNAVERRRRDLIKEKIKELGVLVPPLLLTPEVCAIQALLKQASQETQELLAAVKAKDSKPNKALILHTSVDYIRHLAQVLERQKAKRAELEAAIARAEARVGKGLLDTNAVLEFNPDEFFSDALAEGQF